VTYPTDDLATLLVPRQQEHTGYGQGIIRGWNPETFENQVEFRGAILTNLPVMSGTEALTYQPGDVVLLMRWTPTGGGLSSYWIAGRPIVPGGGRAKQVVSWMRGSLASAISAEVLADRVQSISDGGIGTRNDIAYGDLSGADVGPVVTDVEISEAGAAIVFVSAECIVNISAGRTGFMSYDVSGPTSRAANDAWAYTNSISGDPSLSVIPGIGAGRLSVQKGLEPGTYSFTCRYRTVDTGGNVQWLGRNLTVIGL
jgi:hypothetical protein